MPVRRINYTGRKRIEQYRVDVELYDDGVPSFTASINLDGLHLPQNARLIVEAKRERSSLRFEWGTVANPSLPANCCLTGMPSNPKFRLMVVSSDGTNRLLALANDISPKREGTNGEESLLWLEEVDLGKEVWRLDFGEPGENPKMLINKGIPGISAAVREDEAFLGLVIPEVLRTILTRALIVEEFDLSDEEGDWSDWISFVSGFYDAEFPIISDDPDVNRSSCTAWIEGAVEAFVNQRFPASEKYETTWRSQ